MKKKILLLLLISLFMLTSCDVHNKKAAPQNKPGEEEKDEKTRVESILWQPDQDGNIRLYTNDSRLLGPKGTSGWKWGNLVEAPMNEVEIKCFKVSGHPASGYGVIFCVQEDSDPADGIDDMGHNFYTVLIDTQGWFIFGKVVDRVFFELESWALSAALVTGYNAPNTIKVKYEGDYTFKITFNGKTGPEQVRVFQDNDTEHARFEGGRYGYIVTLASNENFPNTPVDVRFKQIIPNDILFSKQFSPAKQGRSVKTFHSKWAELSGLDPILNRH